MSSFARTLGAFLYTSILSLAFMLLSIWLLCRCIIYVDGFWLSAVAIAALFFGLGWLSEKGLQYLSIPYNWLWDNTKKTRITTSATAIIFGLWTICAPFRIPVKFSAGDWIISVIWMLLSIVLYFNLTLLPFISPHMGVMDEKSWLV